MYYYFKLQYRRLKRDLISFGVNPYGGIGFYILSFIFLSELIFKKTNKAPIIYFTIPLLIAYTLSEVNRNVFLKSIFPPDKYAKVRLAENLLCALPFSIFMICKSQYALSLIIFLFSGFLPLYHKAGRTGFRVPSPFSGYPYEFTVGFRRSYLFILCVYGLTGISIYYHNPDLGLFSLLILYLICFTFYSHQDPIYYVWIHAQSSKLFLKNKMKVALSYSFSLSIPILVSLISTNPANTPLIVLTAITGSLYTILGVLGVYANFPKKMTVSQSIQISFGIVLPPFLFLVIPNLYFQAVTRLKTYLQC